MKKYFCIILIGICSLCLYACSDSKHGKEVSKWDCTVVCAENSDDSYVVTYSEEKIISDTGVLSIQNRNDFDIIVHLLAEGQEERTSEIEAGDGLILHEVTKNTEYTVGCHADVAEGTEIRLMVYDGEETEIYSN